MKEPKKEYSMIPDNATKIVSNWNVDLRYTHTLSDIFTHRLAMNYDSEKTISPHKRKASPSRYKDIFFSVLIIQVA